MQFACPIATGAATEVATLPVPIATPLYEEVLLLPMEDEP